MTHTPDPYAGTYGPIVPMPHPFKKGGPVLTNRDWLRTLDDPIVAPPYISIDIETTGLDPSYCQILEVGAIIDDWLSPLDRLPRFHCYVIHDHIIGDPFALSMNAEILRRIANRKKPENKEYNFFTPNQVVRGLRSFIASNFRSDTPIVAAGKNYARFDDRFLNQLPDFPQINLLHRSIDPGMLYWNPRQDRVPPNTKTCLERAGINTEVQHDAINDALDVIRLIRTHVGVPT